MDKKSLAERCKAGDRDALGTLYQTYLRPMREVVSYYVHNSDAVWDILHDGFIIAFGSMDSLRKPDKLEAWLTSIMKNLALQYIREEAGHTAVPLTDIAVENEYDDNPHHQELSWDELDKIIGKLPEGYGSVFRLAVLDGLSHKEIGALLGIAPHSSSSQLSHAKAMLRRMIVEYRIEMGILSLIGIIFFLWHGWFRNIDENKHIPVISKNTDDNTIVKTDSVASKNEDSDSVSRKRSIKYQTLQSRGVEMVAAVKTAPDSIPAAVSDSTTNDSILVMPIPITDGEPVAKEDLPELRSDDTSEWSLALAYSGNVGHGEYNRYRIPNPSLPDVEVPDSEIEVTKKTRHYMPLVVGLSINKSLTSRWSMETGLRYTFLRSDFLSQSKLMNKETIQRIHYIGVPLKFNYRIITYNGFSLYGQGGGALDIPFNGSQSILEYSPQFGYPTKTTINIHAPLQWSVEGGLGIQYHFTPSFGLYVEPSFKYYFNPGSDIKTIRQDKPFEFTIPIGLRLSW